MTRMRMTLICLTALVATLTSLSQQGDAGARRVSSPDGNITFLLSGAQPVVDATGTAANRNPIE